MGGTRAAQGVTVGRENGAPSSRPLFGPSCQLMPKPSAAAPTAKGGWEEEGLVNHRHPRGGCWFQLFLWYHDPTEPPARRPLPPRVLTRGEREGRAAFDFHSSRVFPPRRGCVEPLVGANGSLAENRLSQLLREICQCLASYFSREARNKPGVTYDGEDTAAGALADGGANGLEVRSAGGDLRGWSEGRISR